MYVYVCEHSCVPSSHLYNKKCSLPQYGPYVNRKNQVYYRNIHACCVRCIIACCWPCILILASQFSSYPRKEFPELYVLFLPAGKTAESPFSLCKKERIKRKSLRESKPLDLECACMRERNKIGREERKDTQVRTHTHTHTEKCLLDCVQFAENIKRREGKM